MILNNISKSLSVEVTKFLSKLGDIKYAGKQAFSKARYKLKYEAFIDLNETFVGAYYSSADYQLYKGKYLLLACDGSDYELPWEAALRAEFGMADNTLGQAKCMAKGVKIWDVLNKITVSSALGHYHQGELRLFKTAWNRVLETLTEPGQCQFLLLGDRHYPCFWLMLMAANQGWDFLFRCKVSFCREVTAFMQGKAKEAVLTIPLKSDTARKSSLKQQGVSEIPEVLKIRAIRVIRPTGEETCLITSLDAKALTHAEAENLYPHRWSEETSYYFDKCRTEIENFSAKLPQGIYQEWYANTLCTNITQLLVEQAQELLDEEQKHKDNKYEYQINRSVAAGLVKDELPKMLYGQEPAKRFYERLVKLILRHREPIRPGRASPRKRKHNLKFSMNLRKIL